MALSLQKGGNLSLSKAAPNLSNIVIGLGWDALIKNMTTICLTCKRFMVLLSLTSKAVRFQSLKK